MKTLLSFIVLISAEPALEMQQAAPPLFRGGIEIVRVDVSVTRNGVPVRGLTARDFVVTDNGVRQEVDTAALDQIPLSVQLVLDTSGSVSGLRLTHLIAAGHGLLSALRTGERAGLVTFSHDVRVRVGTTADLVAVRRVLGGIVGDGQTALRDAVQLAIALPRDDGARLLMLVFTDGVDNASWLSDEAVVEAARRAGVVIDVVRVSSREISQSKFVEQLTDATGGRIWSASSDRDLGQLFTKALDEMRGRYLLTFTPRGVTGKGWHELKVKLRDARGDVVARPGYFAGAASPR
jgi:VWFA-related protein